MSCFFRYPERRRASHNLRNVSRHGCHGALQDRSCLFDCRLP